MKKKYVAIMAAMLAVTTAAPVMACELTCGQPYPVVAKPVMLGTSEKNSQTLMCRGNDTAINSGAWWQNGDSVKKFVISSPIHGGAVPIFDHDNDRIVGFQMNTVNQGQPLYLFDYIECLPNCQQ